MGKTIKFIFSGRVQGVFFRENSVGFAKELGLKGYVKNLRDGTVEAVVQGEEEAIDIFISLCKTKQPNARVDGVLEKEIEAKKFDSFEFRY